MKKGLLVILDGVSWGDPDHPCNAVALANTPNLDALRAKQPLEIANNDHHVGLPEGQMGNSEVGHLNIGAGRVIYQDFLRINNSIEDGSFEDNEAYLNAFSYVKKTGGRIHLMGLLGPGGVHGHEDHWGAALMSCFDEDVKTYVHPILDGRDTDPQSAAEFLITLQGQMDLADAGTWGSMIGRYYAMDRDQNWERTKLAYDLYTQGTGRFSEPAQALIEAYQAGEEDEFVKPVLLDRDGLVRDGDACIFLNFRPDRARQITRAFMDPDFTDFERQKKDILWVCTTQYDDKFLDFPNVEIAYGPQRPTETLGEHISSLGLRQFRISETEKYAHVTYFLNGGREEPFAGEDRTLIPSPKVATYDLQPEMNAAMVTDGLIGAIKDGYDLVVVNYPNGDMVGHTGNLQASIQAVEFMDKCLGRVFAAAQAEGYVGLLTSDHGNCEEMCHVVEGEAGGRITSHSMEPSPLMAFGAASEAVLEGPGSLSNVAPTLLKLMELKKPDSMTASSLI